MAAGVAVDHDGLVELAADVGLVGGAEVVAVLVGGLRSCLRHRLFRAWRGLRRSLGGGKPLRAGRRALRRHSWLEWGGSASVDVCRTSDEMRGSFASLRMTPLEDEAEVGAMTASSLVMSLPMTLRSARGGGEDRGDDVGDVGFGEVEKAVEFEEGDFGFDHPELGEVAAGLGFFGAEGWAEAVDLA